MKSRELLFLFFFRLTRQQGNTVRSSNSKFLTKVFQKTASFGHEIKSNTGFLWQLLKAKSLVSAFNFVLKLISQ